MNKLAEGWVESTIGECVWEIRNGTTIAQNKFGKGFPVSRIETIQQNRIDLDRIQHIENISDELLEAFRYKPGDIAFSHINSYEHVGKTALYENFPEVLVHGMNLLRLRFGHNYIQPQYAHLFMRSDFFREEVRKRVGHAVNQVSINQKNLAAVPFLFPPLAEQRRIVAKLEPLLGSVHAYQQRMAKIPVILKRFRQAVLAAACAGRLTAKWREELADVGTVFPLLQETDTDNQNDLPETWAIVSVGDTISGLKYGTSQRCSYEKGGAPVLRIPNIGEGVIDQSDLKYADLPPNELEQLKLHPGDVLLIRSNGSVSLVGRASLVRDSEKGFAYAGYLIRLRPNTSRILPPYLNLVLGIRDVRLQIEIPARSTSGVNNINSDEVKALKIPLPPLAEQAEIVRHVETLFKLADQIEARYQKAKAQVDKLPQSILAKAFRGELVPTEAELARREGRDYEPASVLLERIRSEHAEHEHVRKEKAGSRRKPTTKRDVDDLWKSSA